MRMQATAVMGDEIDREVLKKSLGLVIVLAGLYLAFFISLILNRYRRTKESLEYLK